MFNYISWVAVIVASLTTFVIGGPWYSPMLFGKRWNEAMKHSHTDRGHPARVLALPSSLASSGLRHSPRCFRSTPHFQTASNWARWWALDRKSTRLNSSHANISYAVFCLKKKKKNNTNSPCFLNHLSETVGTGHRLTGVA